MKLIANSQSNVLDQSCGGGLNHKLVVFFVTSGYHPASRGCFFVDPAFGRTAPWAVLDLHADEPRVKFGMVFITAVVLNVSPVATWVISKVRPIFANPDTTSGVVPARILLDVIVIGCVELALQIVDLDTEVTQLVL